MEPQPTGPNEINDKEGTPSLTGQLSRPECVGPRRTAYGHLENANKRNTKKQNKTENLFEQTHAHSWWEPCQPRARGTDDSWCHVSGEDEGPLGCGAQPRRTVGLLSAPGRGRRRPGRAGDAAGPVRSGQYLGSARPQDTRATCRDAHSAPVCPRCTCVCACVLQPEHGAGTATQKHVWTGT